MQDKGRENTATSSFRIGVETQNLQSSPAIIDREIEEKYYENDAQAGSRCIQSDGTVSAEVSQGGESKTHAT